MLTCGLALLLACLSFMAYDVFSFRRDIVERVSSLAEVVGKNTTAAIDFNDTAAAEQTLAALHGEPNIVLAHVHLPGGDEFASYARSGSVTPPEIPATFDTHHEFSGGYLHLFRPITRNDEEIGMIELVASLDQLQGRMWRYLGIVAFVFLVSATAAFWLATVMGRVVSRPILDLARVARAVAQEKNYTVRATKGSDDELGQLVDGFNEMLAEIHERDFALEAARDTLEHRVRERTQELRRTEAIYRSAIAGAGAVPYSLDFKTRSYVFMGEGIQQLIGYAPEEMTPGLWRQIIQESVMLGETAGLGKDEAARRVVAGELRHWRCDMRVVTRDRSSRWLSDASVQNLDAAGKPMGSMGILQDITERKQAEISALAFSKLGRNLSGAASNEVAAKVIAEVADDLFGWDAFSVQMYSKKDDTVYSIFEADTIDGQRVHATLPDPRRITELHRRILARGGERVLRDAGGFLPGTIAFGDKSRPSASLLFVPIRAGTEAIGILSMHSYSPNAYTEQDLGKLQVLADQCSGALARIRADEARRDSESQFRLVWNNSADGLRLTDREGTVLMVNDAYCRMTGKSKAEVEGQPLTVIHCVETAEQVLRAHQDRMDSGATQWHMEVEVKLWNGREVWFELSNSILNLPGQPVLLLSMFRDITERKRAEAALAEASNLMETLLENSPDHIYFKDRESRFLRYSKRFLRRFGVADFRSLHHKTDFDIFDEAHARPAYEDEQEIIRTGQPIIGKAEQEVWLDGRVTWALTSKLPWRDAQGRIIGTFGISKDITALKEAEAKLEQTHKQLLETSRQAGMAEVATSVLHNVGNVLNSVNTSASVLADRLRNSQVSGISRVSELLETNRHDLAGFLTANGRADQVINYLKSLTQHLNTENASALAELKGLAKNIEHIKEIVAMQQSYARISGVTEAVKPTDLVEDALRMNAGALARHQVKLVRDYAPDVPEIMVEKHKVLQILVNLIRNAKYACDDSSTPDKSLTLRVTHDDCRVRITVADNGVGISPENLTRIFSHGFTTRKEGHGFGLHSGALAARELGGALTVHSDGPGRGAELTLELPCQPPGNSVAPAHNGAVSHETHAHA